MKQSLCLTLYNWVGGVRDQGGGGTEGVGGVLAPLRCCSAYLVILKSAYRKKFLAVAQFKT